MLIVDTNKIDGTLIPEPHKREIKVVFSPDNYDVDEITFSLLDIYPGSKTAYHEHLSSELIYIINGKGIATSEDKEASIKEGSAIWCKSWEKHGLTNTGSNIMTIITVYVPGASMNDIIKKAIADAKKES